MGAAYGAALWEPIRRALPENDLWWMVPVLSQYVQGKSLPEVLAFLINPHPVRLAPPALKSFILPLVPQIGLQPGHLIAVSMLLHFLNAGLVYGMARGFRMPRRAAFFSACVYLTMFAHFHAALWPTASQHLIAVTNILLLLVLYFGVERKTEEGKPAGWIYVAALAAALMGSFQRSTFIAPAMMAAHLIFFSRDRGQRAERYRRWLPAFFVFMVYPILVITWVGDAVVTESLRKLLLPDLVKLFLVTDPLVKDPVPPWAKAVVVLGAASALLWWGKRLAGLSLPRGWNRRAAGGAAALLLGMIWLALCRADTRQALLPYNLLTPFLSTLTGFLEPLQAAFLSDSLEPFHYIPPRVSPWSLLLSLAILWAFIRSGVRKNRALSLFLLWYLLNLVLLTHQDTSFPPITPSRYFIYFSPIFSVVFASVLTPLLEGLAGRLKLRGAGQALFVCGLWAALCLPNLAAIRVELFRGKLANTYILYDHYRVASLIHEDLSGPPDPDRPRSAWVKGMEEIPLRAAWPMGFPFDIPDSYDHLRLVSPLFGNLDLRSAPQETTGEAGRPVYTVQGDRVLDPQGRSIGKFASRMESALQALERGEREQASALLEQAIRTRPFFISYLLQPHFRRMDLRWITGGRPLGDWAAEIGARFNTKGAMKGPRMDQTAAVIRKELSDYELCLFFYAYLQERAGKKEPSRYWLSQLKLLENDPEDLMDRIGGSPLVRADPDLQAFLKRLGDPFAFDDPYSPKKEDYAVGRFLIRLLLGRDIRSSWDTRATGIL